MAKHYSSGTLGDIALDDVSFVNCMQPLPPRSCSGNSFKCDSGHCIDQSAKCDFEPDCCDGTEERNSTCTKYNRYCFGLCRKAVSISSSESKLIASLNFKKTLGGLGIYDGRIASEIVS